MDSILLARFWLLLAAVGGALMPVALNSSGSRSRAVVQVICGTLVAVFLAPAFQRYFLPEAAAEVQAGVAFLVGCFGLKVTVIAQRLLDRHGEGVAERVIERVTGGGK
ncbi:hypothetical protein KPL74_15225 [Bacillus sp. NP157]|nr:hypothetical protein KPL74_15225 [Bacillus sp. NP157]